MDRKAARDLSRLLATLIGELMEDHADLALSTELEAAEILDLRHVGEDIACLATAIEVVTRRAEADPIA
jgi:hypothetical protein